ncbi:sigma-70 family RNA polymerase sigma factor [Massilia endophytica]|uniref:sigma-70 family RNA polymerase sigma factor n=1 Tax=Massilia endophytica TaxID=2899220 RepID=UPI0022B21E36|nr:sigma-70 family RNA polymerase sigma factor [Massilia endophytica]
MSAIDLPLNVLTPDCLHRQLEAMRPMLLRFAQLQLRDENLAEDAVQEALLAVIEKPERFAGQSSLRTYVTGILKHKIVDALRRVTRERRFHGHEEGLDDEVIDALFQEDGHTHSMPRQWGDPDAAMEQKEFFRVMEMCLARLPEKIARVFLMREWLEMETEEICLAVGCTAANAWVMLYRARIRLRECLDLNWFGARPV